MADHNIEGHFDVLLRILRTDPWHEIWSELGFEIASFEGLASVGVIKDCIGP